MKESGEGDDEENPPMRSPRLQLLWGKKSDDYSHKFMLIGKIMATKRINRRIVVATIRNGWNISEDTQIVEFGSDTFVFTFSNLKEKERILRGRPWSIQGMMMSIQEWSDCMVVSEVNFNFIPFWIQFHNLPLGILDSEENLSVMGQLAGQVVLYEKPTIDGKLQLSFGRARVLIDITKPLIHGFWVDRPGKSDVWVEIKYERLQSFCYRCGKIDHDGRLCKKSPVCDEEGKQIFGPWLAVGSERDIDTAIMKGNSDWIEEDFRVVGKKSEATCQYEEEKHLNLSKSEDLVSQDAQKAPRAKKKLVMDDVQDDDLGVDQHVENVMNWISYNKKASIFPKISENNNPHVSNIEPVVQILNDLCSTSRNQSPEKSLSFLVCNSQLSPISEVSSRLLTITLKRETTNLDSSTPRKRLCLSPFKSLHLRLLKSVVCVRKVSAKRSMRCDQKIWVN